VATTVGEASGKEEFKCSECGKAFSSKRGLTVHMRVHKKK